MNVTDKIRLEINLLKKNVVDYKKIYLNRSVSLHNLCHETMINLKWTSIMLNGM